MVVFTNICKLVTVYSTCFLGVYMKSVIKYYSWFFAVMFVFFNCRVLPAEFISGNPDAPDGQSFSFGL